MLRLVFGIAALSAVILGCESEDPHTQAVIDRLHLDVEPNFHRRLDKLRKFIIDNSYYRMDDDFHAYRGKSIAIIRRLLASDAGRGQPISLECSSRAQIMARVLHSLGYETRRIDIFDSQMDRAHTFFDARNPKTGQWESQDLAYDVYWRRKSDGTRVTLVETAEELDELEPCGRATCGWQHTSGEGVKAKGIRELLDILSVTDRGANQRYSVYTSRADIEHIFTKDNKSGLFCDVMAKRCRDGFKALF